MLTCTKTFSLSTGFSPKIAKTSWLGQGHKGRQLR